MNDALRILVVEDEILVARDLEATLKRLGFEVTGVCPTGEAALESVRRDRPQVVLMDIRLGSAMDGVETATRLRAEASLPVVFLTGHADEETLRRALTAEPYGCLLKPFDENGLRSALELAYARNASHTSLQASGDRLESTLRSMAEGVIATNLLGAVTFLNPVAEAITGWTHPEAAGRPLRDVFRVALPGGEALEAAGLVLPGMAAADGTTTGAGTGIRGGAGQTAARTILLTDREGRTVPIREITSPMRDARGSLSGIVVVFHRHTGAETAGDFRSGLPDGQQTLLSDSTHTGAPAAPPWPDLSGIVGSISDPLLAVDTDWRVTWLNSLAAEALGHRREDMSGQVLWDLLPPSIHRLHYHVFSTALTRREAVTLDMEHPARGVWFRVQLYPFAGGLLALFRDITALRREEEEHRRMEKLENLGLLARGFAHDFNNLLTILLGNLSLAETTLMTATDPATSGSPPGTPFPPEHSVESGSTAAAAGALEELRTALRATAQAQNLVQQLLIFARGGAPIRQWTDPGRVISGWFAEWPGLPDVEYRLTAPADTWRIEWDRHQIRRVLSNLTRNAEQALTPGGLRRISITLRQSSRPWPVSWDTTGGLNPPMAAAASVDPIRTVPASGQPPAPFAWAVTTPSAATPAPEPAGSSWLVLEVADTGPGMDPEVLAHALEPYFTTRDDHNASGLGLTVCEAITRAHGGVLKMHSLRGEGVRIRAAFPLNPGGLPAEAPSAPWSESRPQPVSRFAPPPPATPAGAPSTTVGPASAGMAALPNVSPSAGLSGIPGEPVLQRAEDAPPRNHPPVPVPRSGTFRVLILEDEPLIRQLLLRHLQSMGGEVTPTAEGSEAVRAYAGALRAGTAFDLVVMDLSIPGGMGGALAMEKIRSLDPGVTAIVSSGYSDDPVMSRHTDYGFRAVLPKPWQAQDLKTLVHELLPHHFP